MISIKKAAGIGPTAWTGGCPGDSRLCGLRQEAGQVFAAIGMLQLRDRLGFDLPNPFAGDFEDAADLFERVGVAVIQPIAQPNDLPLAVGERLEQRFDLSREAVHWLPILNGLSLP